MQVQLDDRQRELLGRIMNAWVSDLKMEISNTEDYEFRRGLKEDREIALSILEQVDRPLAEAYRRAS